MIVRRTALRSARRWTSGGQGSEDEKRVLGMTKKQIFEEVERKVTRWEEMKAGAGEWWKETKAHYVGGTRELWSNIKMSSQFARKAMYGHILTRRERRLITRTLGDVFRVIPFSMFVIIPFMEFLLPVALKVFPNMLPSTYNDPKISNAMYAKRLSAQVELTKLLQDTLEEMAVTIQKETACAEKQESARKLAEFMLALRNKEKTKLTHEELKKLLPLFNSDLGLSKMRRKELIAMCKLLETPHIPFASEESLRIGLRMHLRRLKADDAAIQQEKISSLSDKEVIQACKMRAIKVGSPPDIPALREDLSLWIELSRQPGVSNSLLVLSRILPLDGIRKVAKAAAEDVETWKVTEIERSVEEKEAAEEREQILKERGSEYLRRAGEEERRKASEMPAGMHVFFMSMGDLWMNEKKGRIISSLSKGAEGLRDTAEEIMELKEDTIEFKEEVGGKTSNAMGILEKRIAKNITTLQNRLLTEQDDFIAASAKILEHQTGSLSPIPAEIFEKLSSIQEAVAPPEPTTAKRKHPYAPVPYADPDNQAAEYPSTLSNIITAVEEDHKPAKAEHSVTSYTEEKSLVTKVKHI
eukprot:TRINITY_DN3898_c0_g1_i1.p1 TRINITY_DN3898_c0_g1~~TRINITY_DN3898_c0_g1_i1.p1  ORF type:complete len:601 (+),score=176.65 TRINITY_DN3898_c0_g1_i1:53-1804(+)